MSDRKDDMPHEAELYTLGLMDAADARAFERRIASEPTVAAEVGRVRDALLPLDLSAPDLVIDDTYRARVMKAVQEVQQGTPKIDNVMPLRSTMPVRRLPNWAAIAAMLVLAIVGFALGSGLTERGGPDAPLSVAVLQDEAGTPRALIEAFDGTQTRVRFLSRVELPTDRVLQVWTLPDPSGDPVSLGVLPNATSGFVTGRDLPDPAAAQLYEITVEPEGGSPTGKPTGRIVAKGAASLSRP